MFQVSNRLPFVLSWRKQRTVSQPNHVDDQNASEDFVEALYRKPSAGGLVTAVAPVMVQSGGIYSIGYFMYYQRKKCFTHMSP